MLIVLSLLLVRFLIHARGAVVAVAAALSFVNPTLRLHCFIVTIVACPLVLVHVILLTSKMRTEEVVDVWSSSSVVIVTAHTISCI